jgi:signal transduction histidine kinase
MHDVIENVLSVYRSRLLAHNLVVETKFNELRRIRVRSGEMIQIFSNLVSNALDAMPQGGKLSIATSSVRRIDGEGLQVVVNDTGVGIRRDLIGKVFEPFFSTKGNLGTGIGLWVAKQLVERHGGQISISSSTDPDDRGTSVTVYLPFDGATAKKTEVGGSESGMENQSWSV